MLAALLPLLEALGAEGGATAALGGGMSEGGLMASLGRMAGGIKGFGSEQELGGALRKISDLSASVQAAQESMEANRTKREAISSQARDDERQYAFSDPGHAQQLAELARQHQAQQASMQQAQRQMATLQQRAALTTDPRAASFAALGRAGAIAGIGTAVGSAIPHLANNLPGSKIVANSFNFAAGETNSNVAGQMLQFPTQAAGHVVSGASQGAALGSLAGPLGTGVGAALGGLSAAATEVSRLPTLIKDWGEALVEGQRGLSRYNGVLAKTFAEQERRTIVRGIQSGGVTGGATADLSSSMQDLLDEIQPMRDTVTVGLARGLDVAVKALTRSVQILEGLWEIGKHVPVISAAITKAEAIAEKLEADSREKHRKEMEPVVKALRDLTGRDKSKPKDVPRR